MVLTNDNELKKEVLSKNDPTTAYIILQNRKYQEMIEAITNENISIKQTLEEQENELDSLSKSKTCLQGYIKNEYEYAQNWKFITSFHKDMELKAVQMISISIFVHLIAMSIGMILVSDIKYLKMYIVVINSIFVFVCTKYAFTIYSTMYQNKEIKKIMDEIKKIEKSNLYIQDLIDNI